MIDDLKRRERNGLSTAILSAFAAARSQDISDCTRGSVAPIALRS